MTRAIDVHCHLSTRPQYEAWGPYLEPMERYYKFRPDVHSDTEMIVHAWEQWGETAVQRFRGMFAFAVWDERKQTLWLGRDRLGKKPLYYCDHQGSFLFGSEIKTILEAPGTPRDIDPTALWLARLTLAMKLQERDDHEPGTERDEAKHEL